MKVAVVGAGVMGCAAAWALRERGADVTVHEQFELDTRRGSSHGRSRIFRIAYPDPYWIRLAQEAYAGWRDLERASGEALLGLYGLVELASDSALTSAREHAWYPLDQVVFRAPVLHPPSVRLFDADGDFAFANPAAIIAAHDVVPRPAGVDEVVPVNRVAAIIDADGQIGGFTPMIEWVAPALQGAKARDFALSLGPIVTTPDEHVPPGIDWERLRAHAAANTRLYPGDILAV